MHSTICPSNNPMAAARTCAAFFIVACLAGAAVFAASTAAADVWGAPEAGTPWHGYARYSLDVGGRTCTVIIPGEAAEGAPWLLRTEAPLPEASLDQRLLEKGLHIVHMDVADLYGNGDATALWEGLYDWARLQFDLAAAPALAGMGQGSLLAYNWAAVHPERVACIYLEMPWLQLAPTSDHAPDDAARDDALAAHGADGEEHHHTPIGLAPAIGEANIPVMHVYDPRRAGVAPDRNREQFHSAYRLAGGRGYQAVITPTPQEGARHDLSVSAMVFLLTHTGQLPEAPPETPIPGASQWRVADFAGRAAVRVLDDVLVLEEGDDMTGITSVDTPPRMNYEVALDAMRLAGGDFFCGLTAPYHDKSFSLVVGGWGGTCVGISSLDWLDAYHNETAHFRSFDDHRWYRIRLRVEDDTIQAWIDGEEVVNINVANRDVDIRWEMEPTTPLGVATWRTTGAVKNFSIRAL